MEIQVTPVISDVDRFLVDASSIHSKLADYRDDKYNWLVRPPNKPGLAKRMRSFCARKKNANGDTIKPVILSDNDLGSLGSVIDKHVTYGKYNIVERGEYTKDLGEYRDGDSCFVRGAGEYNVCLHMVNDDPRAGWVFSETSGQKGRCISYRHEDYSGLFIFNSYGVGLSDFARLLAGIYRTKCHGVDAGANIYHNHGRTFYIGDTPPRQHVRLNIEDTVCACGCGKMLNGETSTVRHEMEIYASDCCIVCDDCDKRVIGDAHSVNRRSYVCVDCSGNYTACSHCKSLYHSDHLVSGLCPSCGISCSVCDNRFVVSEISNGLCDACGTQCRNCGERHATTDLVNELCESCQPEACRGCGKEKEGLNNKLCDACGVFCTACGDLELHSDMSGGTCRWCETIAARR